MEKTKKITKGIGKVFTALLGIVLMPVLIWVAMGTAIYQKTHVRKAQTETTPTFKQILQAR